MQCNLSWITVKIQIITASGLNFSTYTDALQNKYIHTIVVIKVFSFKCPFLFEIKLG